MRIIDLSVVVEDSPSEPVRPQIAYHRHVKVTGTDAWGLDRAVGMVDGS